MTVMALRAEHRVHASCVQLDGGDSVLIIGPSGAGKSTLCLMLIERFMAALVADDQVLLAETVDGRLMPRCPEPIKGRLEVRHVGLVPYPVPKIIRPLALVIDLTPQRQVPRLPEARSWSCGAVEMRSFALGPLDDHTADRVLAAYRLTLAGKSDHSVRVDNTATD